MAAKSVIEQYVVITGDPFGLDGSPFELWGAFASQEEADEFANTRDDATYCIRLNDPES